MDQYPKIDWRVALRAMNIADSECLNLSWSDWSVYTVSKRSTKDEIGVQSVTVPDVTHQSQKRPTVEAKET